MTVHEVAAAQAAVETALAEARRQGARRVTGVEVEVGTLEGIGAEQLEAAFEEHARGTIAQGASLSVRYRPARGVCDDCGHAADVDLGGAHFHGAPPAACERCGGRLSFTGGRGVTVLSARLDLPD